jgi:acetolactate synthase-1/2/3 large subunit
MPLPCAIPGPGAVIAPPSVPDLAEAAARLATAKQPVILAGGGARHAGLALQALAERLDAPVIQTTNARGLMHAHPLAVPASPSFDAPRALIAASDQIVAVGTELGQTDYDMYVRGGLPDLSGMIRIDVCADQLARHPAAVALRADARQTLDALLPLVAQKEAAGATRAAQARAEAYDELTPAMQDQLGFLNALRDTVPGAIIVGDSTQPVYAGNLYYDHDRPGGWFNAATGFGALGYAPGAAVGAALAAPGTPVFCLIGDGGLQFSPGELRTAVDEGLPITYLVWNNAGYGEIASAMRHANTEVIGCTPSPLRLGPFAAACDLPFQQIPPDPEALKQALRSRAPGPNLIEIRDL